MVTTHPPREQRAYSERFDKSKTRYVNWELNLQFPASDSRRSFVIEQLWYRADGSLLTRQNHTYSVRPGWTWSYHVHSWGWNEPGNWSNGAYRVDLYVDGQKVASGSFEIYDASSAKIYNSKGGDYFKKGMYDEAIAEYTKAIEINPNYALAYLNRGSSYKEKGNLEQAILDYTRALELNLKLVGANFYRGLAYLQKGQYDQAISDITKFIEKNPRHADAYHDRGVAYFYNDQYDLAIADYTKSIEIKPKAVAYNDRGSAYLNNRGSAYLNKGWYDQALTDFNKAIELDPRYSGAYLGRAKSYYYQGEYDKAWDNVCKVQELGYKVPSEFLEKVRKAKDEKKQTVQYNISPEDSQEIKQLVERLNKNYRDTILFQRAGEDYFADDFIIKTRSVGYEEDFKLVQRYLYCKITSPGWRFPDNPFPADYRMTADSVKDCDQNRYGLKWEEKTERAPLPQIKPLSIKVLEIGKSDSGPSLVISLVYKGYDMDDPIDMLNMIVGYDEFGAPVFKDLPGFSRMRCKNRTVCEQMASDLRKLVEIGIKYVHGAKPSADPSQLKAAWDMGTRWSIAALFHAEGKPEKANLSLAEARKLAQQFGTEIPDLPAIQNTKTGTPIIVRYINVNRKPIISKIQNTYGTQAAACFDLATSVYALRLGYEINNAEFKSQLVRHIKKTGASSGLPKNLWEPVVSKAEANAPIQDYDRVVVEMHVGMRDYLSGKKQ